MPQSCPSPPAVPAVRPPPGHRGASSIGSLTVDGAKAAESNKGLVGTLEEETHDVEVSSTFKGAGYPASFD